MIMMAQNGGFAFDGVRILDALIDLVLTVDGENRYVGGLGREATDE